MEDKKIGVSSTHNLNSVPDVGSSSFHYPSNNSSSKKESMTDKMRENPWILSTIVLGVVTLVLLFGSFNLTGNAVSGNVVSGDQAAEDLLTYLNGVADSPVTLVSVEEESGFYLVNVDYKGEEMPIYVTKDGEKYTPSLIPLVATPSTPSDAGDAGTTPVVDVEKSDKPVVDLFIMSHCPYGTQAEKGIIPVVEALGDSIDFNLRFVSYAMHPSAGEVQEELNQYCIREEQEDKLTEYLTCFLEAGDGEGCLASTGIDMDKLNVCTEKADKEFNVLANLEDQSTWLSGRYPLIEFDKELNEQYGVQGSPTLVVNGQVVSAGRSPQAYMDVICQSFNDVPEACEVSFSTDTYSPGFGYSLSAADASAVAQCA